MVYVMGAVGVMGGFLVGQMVLYFLLRHKTTEDLLHDKKLRLKYGIINWGFALLGGYSMIEMYKLYFGPY
jgi:hypothetical protein